MTIFRASLVFECRAALSAFMLNSELNIDMAYVGTSHLTEAVISLCV